MNKPVQKQQDPIEELVPIVLVVAAVTVAVFWAGAQLAALMGHQQVLEVGVADVGSALIAVPHHLGDPRQAWPTAVRPGLPGPLLYWFATALVATSAGWLAFQLVRLFNGRGNTLDRRTRLGVPTQGRLAGRSDLRPLLVSRPVPGRFTLGRVGRQLVATEGQPSARQRRRTRQTGRGAVALIGPTRSGKTTAAIGGILDWHGPAVLCSVKADLLAATASWRESIGDVQVFDPTGISGRPTGTWSPLGAARTSTGAVRAARAITEATPRSAQPAGSDDFWSQMAEGLLAALLCLASNCEGRTFDDVVRWVLSTDMPTDNFTGEVRPLVRALGADSDPSRKEAGKFVSMVLDGLWRNDPRTVSSVYATARTIVWPFVDPLVANATKASTISLDWLYAGPNTLYVAVPLADQLRLRPVFGGMLNDLVGQAFDRFVRTNQPLDPPLLLVIDEAAGLKPDQLPDWTSTLSGIGVQLVTIWQSVQQIETAYGRASQTILTNHLSKLFYAGMSDVAGLNYVSQLVGDEHVPSRIGSAGLSGEEGPVATVPLIPPAAFRQLHPGDALLVHGTLPPAHVRLRPWYRDRKLRSRSSGRR